MSEILIGGGGAAGLSTSRRGDRRSLCCLAELSLTGEGLRRLLPGLRLTGRDPYVGDARPFPLAGDLDRRLLFFSRTSEGDLERDIEELLRRLRGRFGERERDREDDVRRLYATGERERE